MRHRKASRTENKRNPERKSTKKTGEDEISTFGRKFLQKHKKMESCILEMRFLEPSRTENKRKSAKKIGKKWRILQNLA